MPRISQLGCTGSFLVRDSSDTRGARNKHYLSNWLKGRMSGVEACDHATTEYTVYEQITHAGTSTRPHETQAKTCCFDTGWNVYVQLHHPAMTPAVPRFLMRRHLLAIVVTFAKPANHKPKCMAKYIMLI
jgi:hypothetical protein